MGCRADRTYVWSAFNSYSFSQAEAAQCGALQSGRSVERAAGMGSYIPPQRLAVPTEVSTEVPEMDTLHMTWPEDARQSCSDSGTGARLGETVLISLVWRVDGLFQIPSLPIKERINRACLWLTNLQATPPNSSPVKISPLILCTGPRSLLLLDSA